MLYLEYMKYKGAHKQSKNHADDKKKAKVPLGKFLATEYERVRYAVPKQ